MSHDFKTLSLSFTAGVAIAVLFPPPHPILASAAVVYSSLAATLYYSKRVHASSIIPYIVLFLLGINSYLCSGFGACLGSVSQNHIVKTALGSFQEAISRLNLSGEQTEALATALLTGDRKLLSAQTISDFRTAGASHILALSGLHLGLISAVISKLLAFMGNSPVGYRIRSIILIVSCLFYSMMTGASPSVVRAFLFITFHEIAKLSPERANLPLNCYFCALMIQLMFTPESIISPGFQLSYLAMLGIYVIFPRINGWLPEEKSSGIAGRIWKCAALSISCQTTTAPAAWLHFRSFPINFLITNIISLPLCELFICSCIGCVILDTLGVCPEILKSLTSEAGQALLYCIHVIALL